MDDNNDFIPEAIKPGMVDPMDSEKLSYIINQENKCCCKINSNGNGTGFFCKIILNESLKILPVLMTCNHVLTENDIKIGKSINYSLYNGKKKFNIIIDNSRLVYTNSEMDFTIIQLWKNEYISLDYFLSIDDEVLKGKSKKDFIENSICLFHYPKGLKSHLSFGIIKSITEDKEEIQHNCGSESGSSGGPLINLINFKLIGIHKGHKNNKIFNLGQFIKPIMDNFFKNIDLKKIKLDDDCKENKINKKDSFKGNKIQEKTQIFNQNFENVDKNIKNFENKKNLSKSSNKNEQFKSFYCLIFFLSIIKYFYIYELIKLFISGNLTDTFMFNFSFVVLFVLDIFSGILLKIIENFFNNKIILIISICLQIIPFAPIKIMSSSLMNVLPFFDDKIIHEIIKGEIIAYLIQIPLNNQNNRYNILFDESSKIHNIIIKSIFIFLFFISILSVGIIIKNFYKFDELKKKEESGIIIKFNYFKKNAVQNLFLLINYSITFSVFPLFLLSNTKVIFEYIFILSDIIGRHLGSISFLKEDVYKPIIFIRYLFIIIVYNFFSYNKYEDINFSKIFIIFIVGLLSGSLTTIGYYIPIKKENQSEKISLLYYIKAGKYYTFSLFFEDEKNIKEIKNE